MSKKLKCDCGGNCVYRIDTFYEYYFDDGDSCPIGLYKSSTHREVRDGKTILIIDDACIHAIDDQPTIKTASVMHGHWIKKPYLMGTSHFCSRCGDNYGMPHGQYKYCPNCGAKMDEPSE